MNFLRRYIFFLALLPVSLSGQLFQNDYSTQIDTISPDRTLGMKLLASTFLNNNEFFNPYQEGYTLIGGILQPSFIFTINQNLFLTAGVHFRKYFGTDDFIEVEPILNITFIPGQNLSFVLGSFEGGQNHFLPETLFAFENHFTSLVENGFLLKITKSVLNTEAWLDWQKFIEPGDPFREEFTAGLTNRITLYDKNENFHVELPVFFLAHHAGGQINDSNLPVETFYNLSEGIYIDFPSPAFASDITPYIDILFHHSFGDYTTGNGFAIQLNAGVHMNHFELNTGFFNGHDFMAYHGLPLYTSFEEDANDGYIAGGTNNILSVKTGYRTKIAANAFLFIRGEGYYNIGINKFDYTFGVHLQLKDFFGITGKK